jgi:hypothetical protein
MLTPERLCHGGSAKEIHITATYLMGNYATSQARLFLPNCSPTNGTYRSVDATGGSRDGVLRVPPRACGSRACDPRACDPRVRARVRSASHISPCPVHPTFALLVRTPLVYRMLVPKQYYGALDGTVLSRSRARFVHPNGVVEFACAVSVYNCAVCPLGRAHPMLSFRLCRS